MELLFVFAMILIVLYYFYQKRPKTHFPTILYQDHKKHVLNYKKINPNNKQPQDLQYTTYLLSLINELPQDEFILIYACLKKWEKQEEIARKIAVIESIKQDLYEKVMSLINIRVF